MLDKIEMILELHLWVEGDGDQWRNEKILNNYEEFKE